MRSYGPEVEAILAWAGRGGDSAALAEGFRLEVLPPAGGSTYHARVLNRSGAAIAVGRGPTARLAALTALAAAIEPLAAAAADCPRVGGAAVGGAG